MVVSKNTKSQRIVESLINDQQLNNKSNKEKLEKNNKPKNGRKNKKEKLNETKKDLSVQTQPQETSNQYDEFITATPDYLSAQTYEQQQQQLQQHQSPINNNGMNANSSPIQTDYYSIYNQLASNTLLDNVLGYNGYYNPQQMNPYYSPVSNPSPVYSAYTELDRSPYQMYSPNFYSYPLSAPINYDGYVMPYDLGLNQPVKTKKSSKKKNTKKQALRDYRNHEQQVIDQFHKNINENKANKIAGKKKMNKEHKDTRKNRKIASKSLKINTNSSKKVKPIFDRAQIISNTTRPKNAEVNNENQPIFNTRNVFPTYTKPEKKATTNKAEIENVGVKKPEVKKAEVKKPEVKKAEVKKPEVKKAENKKSNTKKASTTKPSTKKAVNNKEPELQSMKPGLSKNTSSGYSFDALPKRNTTIENVLNNELILSFLNNIYNGFSWNSKLTNSVTNRNVNFITKNNTDDTHEVASWKDSQTPGQKYSVASLLAMANSPVQSSSIVTERRVNRKDLYDYWTKMARKSILETKDSEKSNTTHADSLIHRMIQNKAISKNNDKLKQLNKMLTKKSQSTVNEREVPDLFSGYSHHPIAPLNYLNVNINFNSNNTNQHPLAVRFNNFYNHQQNMKVPLHNHGKIMYGRNNMEDKSKESNDTAPEKFLNSEDPNKLFEYLLNLNMESAKKVTNGAKDFAAADLLKPTSQPNSTNHESIATFTSPNLFSIPAAVNHEVSPQYHFNSSYNYQQYPVYYPPTTNIVDFSPYSSRNAVNDNNSNNNNNNNNSLLTVLPQSYSNNSLLSLASSASSIHEMDFSNVRTHYDFMTVPKALPKKSKSKKSKKERNSKETNQRGKSTLSQVQDINNENEVDNTSEPDYSLIDIMFNSEKNLHNKKLSKKSTNKNSTKEGSNTSLVGFMFNDN